MALNYSKLLATAQRMIADDGRLVRHMRTIDGPPPDAAEPWEPASHQKDPSADSSVFTTVAAAMVPGAYKKPDGTIVSQGVWTAYIAPPDGSMEITDKDWIDELDADGTTVLKRYKVDKVTQYMPANITVLFVLRLIG